MRYHLLGRRCGLRVSQLCLGTMTFGPSWGWGADETTSRAMYTMFRDAGCNFIDSANIYTKGESEEYLGRFMEGHRDEIVLATKYTNAKPGSDPNAGGNHRKSMMRSVEESLRRLRTEYIDLYWMHIFDAMTPPDEVMRGFDDLVRQGKILYAGISDTPAWWVAQASTLADLRGFAPLVALQIEWSLLERTVERELVPMARALGLAITPWSPLGGGVLTGKYRGDEAAGKGGRYDGTAMGDFKGDGARVEATVDAVMSVAKELGASPAQVALAWILEQSDDSLEVFPILGARTTEQLEDNLGALAVRLEPRHRAQLDAASHQPKGFPHDFLAKETVLKLVYGGMRDQIEA